MTHTTEPRVPAGRSITERRIRFDMVLDRPPDAVYELWTTETGVDRFFGDHSRIDGVPGGVYEIYFLPRDHPDCDRNSTVGAKMLWAEKPERLGFEWTAPPFAAELNTHPLPTWVDIRLERFSATKTILHLEHQGFQQGEIWDQLVETFWLWWMEILHRLDRHCG